MNSRRRRLYRLRCGFIEARNGRTAVEAAALSVIYVNVPARQRGLWSQAFRSLDRVAQLRAVPRPVS
jgi:hypothetical protein